MISTPLVISLLAVLHNIGRALAQTPSEFSPAITNTLSVAFGSTRLTLGSTLPLEQTQAAPTVTLPPTANQTASFVLLMVDIDAPGGMQNNSYSPFLHWLTPASANGTVNPASAVASYVGPAPPPGTGKHRYVLVLLSDSVSTFQWPQGFPPFDASKVESRIMFNVSKFAAAGDFQPVAATWFTTENTTSQSTTSQTTTSQTTTPIAISSADRLANSASFYVILAAIAFAVTAVSL